MGDVTSIVTRMGWLYLAVLLDLYSRKIIGWSMSNRIDSSLSSLSKNRVTQYLIEVPPVVQRHLTGEIEGRCLII